MTIFSVTRRAVLPEMLDHLAPDDPHARRSRRDLRRIHVLMRSASILRGALQPLQLKQPPRTIIELGAGDGSLMLGVARKIAPMWPAVQLTLLDRQDLIDPGTISAYRRLGWTVTMLKQDALEWARSTRRDSHDLCLATLFLHHFRDCELRELLTAVSARSRAFVACEPRRNGWSHLGSRLVALIGANHVTREDAVTSVAAGFSGRELTQAWPAAESWRLTESAAFPFSHLFTAVKRSGHMGDAA